MVTIVTMKSLIVCVTAVMVSVTEGYKIRRSDCFMAEARDGEESTEMHCTCGGIGDPYSIIMNKVRSGCVWTWIIYPNVTLFRVPSRI